MDKPGSGAALAAVCRPSGGPLAAAGAALAFAGTVVPFAKSWARLRSMTNGRRQTKAILKAIARGEDRSSLFWWMVEHHDEILAAAEGRRIQWGTFCAEAARLGLTDTKGKPPTTRNARETWRQARRAVEEARERAMAKPPAGRAGSKYPSRISPDWRPQIVEQPRPTAGFGHRASSAPLARGEALSGNADGQPHSELVEFPTVDPSGAPLAEGHVFYRGQSMLRRVAEQLARIDRQAREMDRFK